MSKTNKNLLDKLQNNRNSSQENPFSKFYNDFLCIIKEIKLSILKVDKKYADILKGGLENQVLSKKSNKDLDFEWTDMSDIGPSNIDGGHATQNHTIYYDGGGA